MFSAVESAIFKWNPDPRRLHCSNCALARVKASASGPVVFCAAGHGTVMPLEDLCSRGGAGFRVAVECKDFVFSEDSPRRFVDDPK